MGFCRRMFNDEIGQNGVTPCSINNYELLVYIVGVFSVAIVRRIDFVVVVVVVVYRSSSATYCRRSSQPSVTAVANSNSSNIDTGTRESV